MGSVWRRVCIADAPMCIADTFFFACGGILGYSDVLIGPPVLLLGGKKKAISLLVPVGLLIFGPSSTVIIISVITYESSSGLRL